MGCRKNYPWMRGKWITTPGFATGELFNNHSPADGIYLSTPLEHTLQFIYTALKYDYLFKK